MKSVRLKAIRDFVKPGSHVVDVGCDHGYLGIELIRNHLCDSVILSDVSESALSSAKANCQKAHLDIPCLVSDGLKSIPMDGVDTIVISGMGTLTMKEILSNPPKFSHVSSIILQSNNQLPLLRQFMNSIGYYLVDETTVEENSKWYVICSFEKSHLNNSKKEIFFGIPKKDKVLYYQMMIEKNLGILSQIPWTSFYKKIPLLRENHCLKLLLKECQR